MAVMGPALFGVGSTLAPERDAGLMKLKRALPAPTGSYLIAKFLMAMFFAALAMGIMIITAKSAGKISFSNVQLLLLTVTLVLGALPFCALGLFIGAHFSGGAAPGITNLIYLPMIYLGGLFIPLPGLLQKWVVIWPAFHLQQVLVAVGGYRQVPDPAADGVRGGAGGGHGAVRRPGDSAPGACGIAL